MNDGDDNYEPKFVTIVEFARVFPVYTLIDFYEIEGCVDRGPYYAQVVEYLEGKPDDPLAVDMLAKIHDLDQEEYDYYIDYTGYGENGSYITGHPSKYEIKWQCVLLG